MSVAVITGSAGLVGSEASRYFADRGLEIVGIDNDMRQYFFGPEASTRWQRDDLESSLGTAYHHINLDVRDRRGITKLFRRYGREIVLVVHAAAQPSHDWAARQPVTDFSINAKGTLNLLEATRCYSPGAVFIFTSTNKVYGDRPNQLPLRETATRWEIDPQHEYADGINEQMPTDQTTHSLFGASKLAADVLVQEYGRYFGLRTACFRGGCLSGPRHSGTQLHGFLAYLMKCTATGLPYTVLGYRGKQVRDNIHSADLVRAFDCFFRDPRVGEVYNIGGGRRSNCSLLEAITICQEVAGEELHWTYSKRHRRGDHLWWISDVSKFQSHYPQWAIVYDIRSICEEIYEVNAQRWLQAMV